jgi:nitric oxide reductase NorD protein
VATHCHIKITQINATAGNFIRQFNKLRGAGYVQPQKEIMETVTIPKELEAYWMQLDCGFPRVAEVFPDCMKEALVKLSDEGISAYIEYARFLGKMGRGAEPILIFLEEWPSIAQTLGADALPAIAACIHKMYKSPNGKAITPFLQSLPSVVRRLPTQQQIREYLSLIVDFMERTTGSIHGIHQTFASPGVPVLFKQIAVLLGRIRYSLLQRSSRAPDRLFQLAIGRQSCGLAA